MLVVVAAVVVFVVVVRIVVVGDGGRVLAMAATITLETKFNAAVLAAIWLILH